MRLRGVKGVAGFLRAATATSVWTVTEIVDVPPRGAMVGATMQVELAGAPVQLRATLPERLASELSSMG